MSRLVIRDCSVLVVPETGECRVDDHQDIHIHNGLITAVTPTTPTAGDRPPPAAERAVESAAGHLARTGDAGTGSASGQGGESDAERAGQPARGRSSRPTEDGERAARVAASHSDMPTRIVVPGVQATGGWGDEVEVLDGTGLLAVPGLTNSHTHSPMVMMRGAAEDVGIDDWFNQKIWPMETNLTPERVRVGARLACAEMLLAGVTSFVDHYFHADQIAEAALELGIRADLAPTFFSSTGPDAREAAFDAARRIRALGNESAAGRPPRITAGLGPHAPYTVTDEDLARTADVARAEGFRIHLHAAETQEQTRSSVDRLGVTPIEVLARTGVLEAGSLIAHACGLRDSDLSVLEPHASRTAVATCPKVYLKLAMGPTTPIRRLRSIGIAIGIGTDGAAVHNTLDVWESLRLTALIQKHTESDAEWMHLSEALRLATRGGAAIANAPYLAAIPQGARTAQAIGTTAEAGRTSHEAGRKAPEAARATPEAGRTAPEAVRTRPEAAGTPSEAVRDALRVGTDPTTAVTGAIEPGRRADIALLDLSAPHNQPLHNPLAALVYSVRATDVVHVLVDGEIVVRNRTLTTADLREIVAEARSVAHTLTDLSAGGAVQHYAP